MNTEALYVYAITAAPYEAGDALRGIEDRPVRAIEAAGLVALVHAGDGVPYVGGDDDVKRWVLEHTRVVEHVWERADAVLPVTFNVIVPAEGDDSAADRVAAWLTSSAATLRDRLTAVRGKVELRVEIRLDIGTATADDESVAALRAEAAAKPAGLRRLLERRIEQVRKEVAARRADGLRDALAERVTRPAAEVVENRRARATQGAVGVLNVALLVPRERIEALGTELAAIQDEHAELRIRFLGPWPPYSFVEVEGGLEPVTARGPDRTAAA